MIKIIFYISIGLSWIYTEAGRPKQNIANEITAYADHYRLMKESKKFDQHKLEKGLNWLKNVQQTRQLSPQDTNILRRLIPRFERRLTALQLQECCRTLWGGQRRYVPDAERKIEAIAARIAELRTRFSYSPTSDLNILLSNLAQEIAQYQATALCFNYIYKQNIDNAESLIRAETLDLQACDYEGNTLVHKAAAHADNLLAPLLQLGAPLEVSNDFSRTPLYEALRFGNENSVKILLSHGARTDHISRGGTALHLAAIQNLEIAIELLLRRKLIYINAQDDDGDTPLHLALRNPISNVARMLLRHPLINVNIPNNNGNTPLHVYIIHAYIQNYLQEGQSLQEESYIDLLYKCGADLKAINNDGYTPLQLAGFLSQEHILPKILNTNPRDTHQVEYDSLYEKEKAISRFKCAINRNDSTTVRQLLDNDDKVVTVCSVTKKGDFYFFKAAERGFDTIVRLFIEKGCPVNLTDKYRNTAFSRALMSYNAKRHTEYASIVKMLLAPRKIDLNKLTGVKAQFTPLHIAALLRIEEIVQLLIKYGADVNCYDYKHRTPLHLAIRDNKYFSRGDLKNTLDRLLAVPGIIVDIPDNTAATPLMYAQKQKMFDVVQRLLPYSKNSISA